MRDKENQKKTDPQHEPIPLSFYNAEHYADPTTYHALKNIERNWQLQHQSGGSSVKKKVHTHVVWYD